MSTFDPADQAAASTFLVEHLPRHGHFSLATVAADGQPWNVCLDLSWDHGLGIIWKSRADANHSQNVRRDGRVAVLVYSSTPDHGDFALYMTAQAHEVTDPDELRALLHLRYTARSRPMPAAANFTGDAPDRLYIARPIDAYLSDDRHEKMRLDLDVVRRAFQGRLSQNSAG